MFAIISASLTIDCFSKRSLISLSCAASIDANEASNVESFQFDQVGKEEADRVKDIYYQYCNVYSKDIEESRFQIFLPNYLYKEAQAKESGKPLEMNKWYDCTEEESKVGIQAEAAEEAARVLAEEEEDDLSTASRGVKVTGKRESTKFSEEAMGFLPEEGFHSRVDEEILNVINKAPEKDPESSSSSVNSSGRGNMSTSSTGGGSITEGSIPEDAQKRRVIADSKNARSASATKKVNVPDRNIFNSPAFLTDSTKAKDTEKNHKATTVTTADNEFEISLPEKDSSSDGGLKWSDSGGNNIPRP